ncbi:MAG: putative rane protein [Myxococcales bacterium]|nr:putative rane protein [Myxococcales bacterium]
MNTVKRFAPTAARLFLGLVFTVFGLNGFFHFLPMPPMAASPAASFVGALLNSGYLMKLVFATELSAGLLFLAGRFVPLALALIAPVIVNIVAFHAFLAPAGLGLALAVLAAELALAWSHRAAFAPLFQARATARPGEPSFARAPLRAAA